VRRWIAGLCAGAALAIAAAALLVASSSAATPTATGTATATAASALNLCKVVSAARLKAAHITGPCVKSPPVTHSQSSPLGVVQTVESGAHWGTTSKVGHFLSILVESVSAPPAALAYAVKIFRGSTYANGAQFPVKGLATEALATASCPLPPEDDCTTGTIEELIGSSFVTMSIHDPAPVIRPDNPAVPAVDEKNDVDQEDTLKAPFVKIGQAVAARL